jgi:hypothetical protein
MIKETKARTIRSPNNFLLEEHICRILLFDRKCKQIGEAIIDREDIEKCKGRKWRLNKDGYVVTGLLEIYLHHVILGTQPSKAFDPNHIDGNKLNNRRSNLRICTRSQNHANRQVFINNISGFKGVSFHKKENKWRAQICKNYQRYELGEFADKYDAAKAYNNAAIHLFGQFARINIIPEDRA